ncbi:MAG: SLOG family protein [Christensenellales bacterium]
MDIRCACCFTGLRPAGMPFGTDEAHPSCQALKAVLEREIRRRIARGCTRFISGADWGADLMCAQIVLSLRKRNPDLRLVCVLPHEEQAARWSERYRNQYFSVLQQADQALLISRHRTHDCVYKRNREIVNRSRYMIAVYGSDPQNLTAHALCYARRMGRDITLVDPFTLEITRMCGTFRRLGVLR